MSIDAAAPPAVQPLVTEYTVCLLPEGSVNRGAYAIRVAYRGAGRWAVMRWGFCLGTDGDWDYEAGVTSRSDDWLDSHRFDLDTALRLAIEHAASVTVEGVTAAEALRVESARREARVDR